MDAELLARRTLELRPEISTTNPDEVFACPEVDTVLVGTRGDMHCHFVLEAARHGKDVFVEKPMTMTYAETEQALTAAKASGIKVGVGFNRRFAPAMLEAKRIFRETRAGAANIVYRIVDDHRVRPHYIFDMAKGGGHLLTEGCHIFDLLAWFLDSEPVEVYAVGPLETDNTVILKYADGSTAAMVCGGKGGVFYPKELMEVFSGGATIAMDNFFELRGDGPSGSFLRAYPLDPKTELRTEDDDMTSFHRASFSQRPSVDLVGEHAANPYHKLKVDKGHDQEIAEFAKSVVERRPFSIGVVDGARATVCALKAYESIRKNAPVRISGADYGLE